MIRALKKIETYFAKDLWDLDINSLGRMRALQVKFLRLATVFVSELSGEQLALRAMSLVYTTLLTIVPLLAVSFSVLKAFGVHTKLEVLLSSFLEPLGPGGINLSLRIIEFVERVNVGVLGAFGLSALLYTVISQIQKIEVSLNFIWHVSKPRSFSRRVTAYMSILLVGPVLGFSAIGLSAYLMESSLVRRLLSVETVGSAAYLAGHGMTYLLICAFFVFVYVSLPNTKVHFASALVGGIFAGIVWKIMGLVFASFIVTSTQYSAIYSGFALGILFLIWLYWSWFILLVGARVSFYHQYPRLLDFRKESLRLSTRQREKLAMLIM
ncbi:MAG TPA: YihY/virulence factor BrkB family protein, partial [Thermodesulfovibrionales bacterium]|nr:YihY/virulence factor BrkB family protein [Thermodesulfovibrionales bacterium]